MRYEAEWLLECLLLRIKSPTAYEHLKRTGILPLPSKETLRRLVSGMSCHFGFNSVALQAMGKVLEGKSLKDRLVVISMDEVAMLPSLEFNTESLVFDGFTRLKDDPVLNREELLERLGGSEAENNENPEVKMSENVTLADHCLVFMVRPLLDKWIQPFGVFASRGAASGEDLYRLLMAAIIRLEVMGARVLVVVSDGAATNKKVWTLAGLGIQQQENKPDVINNTIAHPTATNENIYFLQDAPHAFKCIRNQMFNHETVQVG
jgi:hypothetical protein